MNTIKTDSASIHRSRFNWVTCTACALCVFIFIGISLEAERYSWAALSKWGCLPADAIWNGAHWPLVTSTFVHLEIWHVAFNVYWLWVLGIKMESVVGSNRYLAFYLVAAIVSSTAQLAASNATGHGTSGVVYAVFGFIWASRHHYLEFGRLLTRETIRLFIVWLVACVVLTQLNIFHVGNAAHASGLVFGYTVGEAFVVRRRRWIALCSGTAMACASIVILFWCPWSWVWAATKAHSAAQRQDSSRAEYWYKHSLELGADPTWVWTSIASLYWNQNARGVEESIEKLRLIDSAKADKLTVDWENKLGYDAYSRADYATAVSHYQRSLKLEAGQLSILQNLATSFLLLGKLSEYQATMKSLQAADPKKAAEVDEQLKPILDYQEHLKRPE